MVSDALTTVPVSVSPALARIREKGRLANHSREVESTRSRGHVTTLTSMSSPDFDTSVLGWEFD